MASTYTLISSQVLASSAASVTFSSIPQTYTDLVLRISARTSATNTQDSFILQFNSDTTSTSWTRMQGNSSVATSLSATGGKGGGTGVDGNTATANTFGNIEIYISNYASTTIVKPYNLFGVTESNGAAAGDAFMGVYAQLFNSTAAISSINFSSSTSYAIGTSAYLYGISNA